MTMEEKREQLKRELQPGSSLTTHQGVVMAVTMTTDRFCQVGMTDRYAWDQLERLIRVGAFTITKPTTK